MNVPSLKTRGELLNCEIFDTMVEAKVIIEKQCLYLQYHSAPGCRPPVPGSRVVDISFKMAQILL